MDELAVDRHPGGLARPAAITFKASRTPKHIPITSARITFMERLLGTGVNFA